MANQKRLMPGKSFEDFCTRIKEDTQFAKSAMAARSALSQETESSTALPTFCQPTSSFGVYFWLGTDIVYISPNGQCEVWPGSIAEMEACSRFAGFFFTILAYHTRCKSWCFRWTHEKNRSTGAVRKTPSHSFMGSKFIQTGADVSFLHHRCNPSRENQASRNHPLDFYLPFGKLTWQWTMDSNLKMYSSKVVSTHLWNTPLNLYQQAINGFLS